MTVVAELNEEDYATPNRLSMYLEMGWSDFLLPVNLTTRTPETSGWPDPKRDAVRPDFYREVADLCLKWSEKDSAICTICDIGAATGRMAYELAARFKSLQRIVAVEPSIGFSNWARILLCEDAALPPVPQLGPVGQETFISAARRPIPLTRSTSAEVSVLTLTAEHYATKGHKFDLVSCLNVVDRHPTPDSLVAALSQLVKPDGILVCSSPLDFQSKWTPKGEVWIETLHQLFSPLEWSDVGESEVYYEFRYYNRVWTRFNCEVVCKRRKTT